MTGAGLAGLLQAVQRRVPALQLAVHAEMEPAPLDGLAAMHAWWAARYPEAGRLYHALRCWGLLVWQPVYLSVLSVHGHGLSPQLGGLRLALNDGDAGTLSLADRAPFAGPPADCLAHAAGELRAAVGGLAAQLGAVCRLNERAAQCLLADCTLAALLLARPADGGEWCLHDWGERWLAALQLGGCSGYQRYCDAGGRERIALARVSCCFHFRRHDGEACSTCPRLSREAQVLRLQAEAG